MFTSVIALNQKVNYLKGYLKQRRYLLKFLVALISFLLVVILLGFWVKNLSNEKQNNFKWDRYNWAECSGKDEPFNQKFELAIPKLNKVRVTFFAERKNIVDGYGYECSKQRVKTRYLLNYKSETKTEVDQLDRSDCLEMKDSKMCEGKRMRCNKRICYLDFQEEVKGWFSSALIRHTCTIYLKRIVSKYLDDILYYDGTIMCKVNDYECRTNTSILAWDKSVIQNCSYRPLKPKVYETVFLNRKHYLHSIDTKKEVHEIVGKVQMCDKTLYRTKYGMYFQFVDFVENQRLANLKIYSKFFASVIIKKPFSIDGYGVECRKIRKERVKYFNFFQIFIEDVHFIELSQKECLSMLNTQLCDGQLMKCHGSKNCSLEYQVNSDGWLSSKTTTYSCMIKTVHIVAKNRNDLLFTHFQKPCKLSKYHCRSNESVVVWNNEIVDNCPFEFVKTTIVEKVFIQNTIFFQLKEEQHTSYYEIVDIIKPCGEKWYFSKEGYYFSFSEDEVIEYQNQTDIFDVNKMASDFIGNKNTIYRSFSNALCKNQLKFIDSFGNDHVKFLINSKFNYFYLLYHYSVNYHVSKDILINKINLLHSLNDSAECMSIEFMHKKINHIVFLKSSQISKFTSKMIHFAADKNDLQLYNTKTYKIDSRNKYSISDDKIDNILSMMYYTTIKGSGVLQKQTFVKI